MRLAAWLLLTLAACLTGMRSADAACGDYVVIGQRNTGQSHAARQDAQQHAAADSRWAYRPANESSSSLGDHGANQPGSQPCQGPNCRRQAPSSPQPAPASRALTVDQWAYCPCGKAAACGAFSLSLAEPVLSLAAGFRQLPEHPPRG
ncbi:MAG TPA: hypothetical protein VMV10_18040 [Pirellulales bacterium]|nr:hypothetical protein [Pirellulales bacterium]